MKALIIFIIYRIFQVLDLILALIILPFGFLLKILGLLIAYFGCILMMKPNTGRQIISWWYGNDHRDI